MCAAVISSPWRGRGLRDIEGGSRRSFERQGRLMTVLTATLIGLGISGAVGALAAREHRLLRATRRSLLDPCAHVLDGAEIRHGGDGFPSLTGVRRGRHVHVEMIPDTIVPRRLPQLWLSITLLDALAEAPSLAILVRPAGYEFYSLTGRLTYALDAPAALPQEVLVRGPDARAEQLLRQVTLPLATALADPRVKEIAITARGLRIIWQAGEGRRGEHLLLRQAVFDGAEVQAGTLIKLLEALETLRSAIGAREQKQAA
jgi:hypothetical protein